MAVRGHVVGASFRITAPGGERSADERMRLEEELLQEAQSLVRQAEMTGEFDWPAEHFAQNPATGVWEKTLSDAEIDRLLRE